MPNPRKKEVTATHYIGITARCKSTVGLFECFYSIHIAETAFDCPAL